MPLKSFYLCTKWEVRDFEFFIQIIFVTLAKLLNLHFLIYKKSIIPTYLLGTSRVLVNKSKVLHKCLMMIMITQADPLLWDTEVISLKKVSTKHRQEIVFLTRKGDNLSSAYIIED